MELRAARLPDPAAPPRHVEFATELVMVTQPRHRGRRVASGPSFEWVVYKPVKNAEI
jgi:hypothetical protein